MHDKIDRRSPFHPLAADSILLETRYCVAFFDRYPVSRGHALVVPRKIAGTLFELPVKIQTAMWDAVRKTRELLIEKFRPDGFNIGLNDGAAAGQTIPHVHIHIIPRYRGDVDDPRGGVRAVIPDRIRYWRD